jgi:NAD(P)-dependent dehydrogenase (short-subunit alcohol dehydrogenase family)
VRGGLTDETGFQHSRQSRDRDWSEQRDRLRAGEGVGGGRRKSGGSGTEQVVVGHVGGGDYCGGWRSKGYELDVRDVSCIRAVFEKVAQDFGRLDIVVNNAGLGEGMAALDVTEEYWDDMLDVNLKGVFFCCQAAGRIMLKQGYGKIINVSSQVSVVGIPDGVAYCASKGGVNQLTKVLALEWSGKGVCVNAVGPTFIYTPGTAERLDTPEFREQVLARIPAGRIGTISDVAGAVVYLASPASDLVTGTLLLVDGGWTAQ